MSRSVVVLVALSCGCSLENTFSEDLPSWPNSAPPEVPEQSRSDRILQVTSPKVDILWMIDNSCSMSDNQTQLTDNTPSFMEFFIGSGLDYHIGVTSSDVISRNYAGSNGTLVIKDGVNYIDPDSPDPMGLFVRMASLGTLGRFPERGLAATFLALEERRDEENSGFYRDEAALHTIVISDEPDYTEPSLITQPEYVDWYDDLKTSSSDRSFSAIVDRRRGQRYENTANQIGGIVWDLTQRAWAQVLERLGLQAAGLSREYFLSQLPVPGTVVVSVEEPTGATRSFVEVALDPSTGEPLDQDQDGEPDGDWTYSVSRNSITFHSYVPAAMSVITIDYTVAAAALEE